LSNRAKAEAERNHE